MRYQVGIIGSGNWGSTVSKIIGENVANLSDYEPKVLMWVYEELFEEAKLSHIINQKHENPKYLPGIKLPTNVVAVTDMLEVVSASTHLVFVLPHQFLNSTCDKILAAIRKDAIGISLTKGLIEHQTELILPSSVLRTKLGIHVSVLSGANIASEIAAEIFSTSTIGCDNTIYADQWKSLFSRSYFKIESILFTEPMEIFGALKNCIAMGIGFSNALGYGSNAKATAVRIGFQEIIRFVKIYQPNCSNDIFLKSFGLDDLIATCFGGRNVRCAESFVRTGKTIQDIEKNLLSGQKLQGPETIITVYNILQSTKITQQFPFLTYIYKVLYEKKTANSLVDVLST